MDIKIENTIEIIRERGYVTSLRDGFGHPLVHFRVIFRALWPTLLVAAILAGSVSFLPSSVYRLLGLNLVLLVLTVILLLQLNVLARKLTELGYIPELNNLVLWKMIPSTKLGIKLYWRYFSRFLSIALFAGFVGLVVYFISSIPCSVVVYLDLLTETMALEGDQHDLPSYFIILRFLAFALTVVGAFLGWIMFFFPLVFGHGSVIAADRERKAYQEAN